MSFRYVPQDKGAVYDYLGSLFLNHPDYDTRTFSPHHSLEGAIQALVDGLNIIAKQLGEERHTELLARANEVQSLFQTGDPDEEYKARCIINYMSALMKAKKGVTIDIEEHIEPRPIQRAD
jgi:hypothetical protein